MAGLRNLIIDCGLNADGGHHLPHLAAVLAAIGAEPESTRILAGQTFQVHQAFGFPVDNCLDATGYEALSLEELRARDGDGARASHRLGLNLLALDAELSAAETVTVLNVTPVILSALVLWLRLRRKPFAKALHIYVLFGVGVEVRRHGGGLAAVEYDRTLSGFFREGLASLMKKAPKVRFLASSRAREISMSYLGASPVAQYGFGSAEPCREPGTKSGQGTHMLLYAGDAKLEKGIAVLPGLIETLCRRLPDTPLMVHVNDPLRHFDGVAARLRAMAERYPTVTLRLGSLSDQDYSRMIRDTKLAVLLHDVDFYHDMESGVAMDCMRAAVPLIAREGTLTAKDLRDHGGADFVFPAFGCLIEKITALLADPEKLKHSFGEVSSRVMRWNGALVPQVPGEARELSPAARALESAGLP